MLKLAALLLAFTSIAAGQEPSKPQLTVTEQIAIQAVNQEFKQAMDLEKQAQDHLRKVEDDIRKAHPGQELDEKTLTLAPIQKPADAGKKDPGKN